MDVTVQSARTRLFNNIGFAFGLLLLPAVTWYVSIAILHYDGALVLPDAEFLSHVKAPSLNTLSFYVAWLLAQITFAQLLPGRVIQGVTLENGSALDYKLNGLLSHVLTLGLFALLVATNVIPATFLFGEIEALLTTANLIVFGLCFAMYAIGRRQATAKEK